jgi:hypothetical protein
LYAQVCISLSLHVCVYFEINSVHIAWLHVLRIGLMSYFKFQYSVFQLHLNPFLPLNWEFLRKILLHLPLSDWLMLGAGFLLHILHIQNVSILCVISHRMVSGHQSKKGSSYDSVCWGLPQKVIAILILTPMVTPSVLSRFNGLWMKIKHMKIAFNNLFVFTFLQEVLKMVSIFTDTQLSSAWKRNSLSKIPGVFFTPHAICWFQWQFICTINCTIRDLGCQISLHKKLRGFKSGECVGQETEALCLQPIHHSG